MGGQTRTDLRPNRFVLPAVLIASCLAIYAFWWNTDGIVLFGNFIQAAALVFAGINLTRAAFSEPTDASRGLLWLAGGIWICWLGQLMETYAELLLSESPYGTVADLFWLTGNITFLIGASVLFAHYRAGVILKETNYALPAIACAVIYSGALAVLFSTRLAEPNRAFVSKLLDIAYPTFSILILFFVSMILIIARLLKDPGMKMEWTLFLAGVLIGSLADYFWSSYQEIGSFTYRFQDMLYFIDYVCIGLAASMQLQTPAAVQNPTERKVQYH